MELVHTPYRTVHPKQTRLSCWHLADLSLCITYSVQFKEKRPESEQHRGGPGMKSLKRRVSKRALSGLLLTGFFSFSFSLPPSNPHKRVFNPQYLGPGPYGTVQHRTLQSPSHQNFLLRIAQSGVTVTTALRLATTRACPALSVNLAPHARLSVISRHLTPRQPLPPLNTPYSSYSQSPIQQARLSSSVADMSSTQPPHPALLIPGPIEFDDAVLQSMSHYRHASLHF